MAILFVVFYPLGVYQIIKLKYPRWAQAVYILLGLPLFLIVFTYSAIVVAGFVLPDLDRSISPDLDRTIWNKEGNYSCTFLKTKRETGNAYELMKIEVEPKGGNWWHYHSGFAEEFAVVSGELVVEIGAQKHVVKSGEKLVVPKEGLHQFYNASDALTTVLVKTTPGVGLEKTIRIAYGLINKGILTRTSSSAPPMQMFLMGSYSKSYPATPLPQWMQTPLFDGLARIAQWRGEDKALEEYFK